MKVILAAMQYGYGDKSRGFSYEYYNFFLPLQKIADSVILFDFMEIMKAQGREAMNRAMLETVKREQPDLVIVVPYTDQFIPEIIDEINRHTTTVGYFFDDMWRVKYARFWAEHFTYVTTSDINGVQKFCEAGYNNAIYSPFACNVEVYAKKDLPKLYDVSFVGGYHPYRDWYIHQVRRAGINAQVWGSGWKAGNLNLDSMVNVFNQSRINLNLSNCVSWDLRYLLSSLQSIRSLRAVKNNLQALRSKDTKTHEQVKGRHFEINSCGGFQLSYYVEGLERCYQIGEEIQLYASPDDLINKIRYYLKHEDEREIIAQRGWKRTLAEHTMEKRFQQIFEQVILK